MNTLMNISARKMKPSTALSFLSKYEIKPSGSILGYRIGSCKYLYRYEIKTIKEAIKSLDGYSLADDYYEGKVDFYVDILDFKTLSEYNDFLVYNNLILEYIQG